MPGFHTDDERVAWAIAESLLEKARAMMRQAESALENFKRGKEINRQLCARDREFLRKILGKSCWKGGLGVRSIIGEEEPDDQRAARNAMAANSHATPLSVVRISARCPDTSQR